MVVGAACFINGNPQLIALGGYAVASLRQGPDVTLQQRRSPLDFR
jgi:hypothetical protein